jgi:hypothetical protein
MLRRLLVALAFLAVIVGVAARTAVPISTAAPIGDGTTDDSAALQALLDRGGLVTLSKGTYRITRPLVIDLDKTGFTAIDGGTVARVVMAGAGPAFKFVGTHAGTADPKTFQANVWEKQRMPAFTGVEIIGDHPEADAVEATGTMQLSITRVLIRHCRHGIHLTTRTRNIIISDSHIYENRGIGIYFDAVNLHQTNVTGCHVSYNDGGGIVVRAGEVRNLQVTGCDIESNQGTAGPPTANVLIDSTGGTNAEVAVTGCTIQHNHNAPGSANIRVKGPSVKWPGTDELRDGHVTITGNVLSDVKVNVHLDHARGVVMTGNTCWTAYEHNLLVEDSASVVVGPNNFDRNPRYNREEKPDTANDLVFRRCSDCTLTGLHVTGVRAARAGVTLEACDRFNVSNLTILDCDGAGLLLNGVTNSRIGGCLIRDDRPGAASVSIRSLNGKDTTIADNALGRPTDIK